MKKSDNPYEVTRLHSFESQLKKIIRKFQNSEDDIEKYINSLSKNHQQGDQIQMGTHHVRKIRIPLKAYKVGKSGGLRLIVLIKENSKKVVPIAIFHKGDINKDGEAKTLIREQLKEILKELDNSLEETLNKKPEALD